MPVDLPLIMSDLDGLCCLQNCCWTDIGIGAAMDEAGHENGWGCSSSDVEKKVTLLPIVRTVRRWLDNDDVRRIWRSWGLPSFCLDRIVRLELTGDGFHGWLIEEDGAPSYGAPAVYYDWCTFSV
ncbi:hypothetical protein ACLOJK_014824 [Asimina triloba]